MEKKLEGKHVFMILLAFFGVMFAVNGVFVYVALTSFSGVTEKDAYVKGLNYNRAIEENLEQRARNWLVLLDTENLGQSSSILTLSAKDRNGEDLFFDDVTMVLKRPAQEDLDFEVTLTKEAEKFVATVEFPLPGQWDVIVLANGAGYDKPYRLEKRLWVK
ncbi:hypothetical protein GUA87_07400 [Sneathiella sp. P13V-1]|uniref:FixH family protein n=1 Tax=Sneathiella sp. P13V-1 TaxID=2697366 RepID=UPI00187B9D71|nr:FixH family protein [Sneathiella sp. P13V-1]MBE7636668.1 hypothetical protein [Sneathiella sp. P13V-1]